MTDAELEKSELNAARLTNSNLLTSRMSDKYYVTNVSGNTNNRRNTELFEYLRTFKFTMIQGDIDVFVENVNAKLEELNLKYHKQKNVRVNVTRYGNNVSLTFYNYPMVSDTSISFMNLQKIKYEIKL